MTEPRKPPKRGGPNGGKPITSKHSTNKNPPRRAGDPKPPGQKPTKFTEEQLANALRQAGGIKAQALRVLLQLYGQTISYSTLSRNIAASSRLQAVLKQVDEVRFDYVENQHWKLIEAGDIRAIQFHLRFKGGDRGYKQAVQHSGDPANPIRTETAVKLDFGDVPLDDLRSMHATLEAARRKALEAERAKANED